MSTTNYFPSSISIYAFVGDVMLRCYILTVSLSRGERRGNLTYLGNSAAAYNSGVLCRSNNQPLHEIGNAAYIEDIAFLEAAAGH